MKARWIWAAAVAAMVWGAGAGAEELCTEAVKTRSGLVRGAAEAGTATCVWRGIPYAAPPVGDLRWKAPAPAPAWPGVREAVEWGHPCMQHGALTGLGDFKKEMSEDCLYLNVWRPARAGKFPVMVWIHGGGYHTGFGHMPLYRGDRLAQAGDVVVVSINYRLNIFGFLAHPALRNEDAHGSTGGYGTMDQAFALQWVHDNIAGFGGDPANVTIFGESAGGQSVCTMLATPLARGLFQRAIFESGGGNSSFRLDDAYAIGRASFKQAGCEDGDLACMRRVPAKRLLEKAGGSMVKAFDWLPCEDGWVLTASPVDMIQAGDFNRVPVMAGTNLDEFARAINLIPKYFFAPASQYEKLIRAMGATPEEAARLVELYPLSEFNNRPRNALGRAFAADAVLTCPVRSSIAALAGQGEPAYLYRFEYRGMKHEKIMGCFHGAEVPFVFGSLDRPPMTAFYDETNLDQARALSRTMQSYWINFAKTGDPNGPGLSAWERFEPDRQRVQVLDTLIKSEPYPLAARCDFWDGYHESRVKLMNHLLKELNL